MDSQYRKKIKDCLGNSYNLLIYKLSDSILYVVSDPALNEVYSSKEKVPNSSNSSNKQYGISTVSKFFNTITKKTDAVEECLEAIDDKYYLTYLIGNPKTQKEYVISLLPEREFNAQSLFKLKKSIRSKRDENIDSLNPCSSSSVRYISEYNSFENVLTFIRSVSEFEVETLFTRLLGTWSWSKDKLVEFKELLVDEQKNADRYFNLLADKLRVMNPNTNFYRSQEAIALASRKDYIDIRMRKLTEAANTIKSIVLNQEEKELIKMIESKSSINNKTQNGGTDQSTNCLINSKTKSKVKESLISRYVKAGKNSEQA